MKKLWWRFYYWPKDNIVAGSMTYNCFGSVDHITLWPCCGGGSYRLIGFGVYFQQRGAK